MKTEVVKCHEVTDKLTGVKTLVGEGNLLIAESLEDMIQMTEGDNPECPEASMVKLFNASRRIRFQALLKSGNSTPTAKSTLAKIEAEALNNPELAALLATLKIVPK